ncbi:hypothetical protein GCM10023147_14040 [Tsukamurella soli]|uniref:Uncharacterized protein n=1 Tax=Tsukamurella soli TaxID=644556 RepID=A0ABP8JBX2_9ACTN
MNIDCSTCAGHPRACNGCVVGLLLGPVVGAVKPATGEDVAAGRVSPGSGGPVAEINRAIGLFADAGMLPRLRSVPPIRGEVRGGDRFQGRSEVGRRVG